MTPKLMNTRAIRFNEGDICDIEKFLKQNPFFDFSSLARIAIRRFIESPDIKVRGIKDCYEVVKKTEISL